MRKIESQMLAALRARKKHWASGNTQVNCASDGNWDVTLHGNCIAYGLPDDSMYVSLAGWPTPTTRSRVSAILRDRNAWVSQSKGEQWYFAPGIARNIRNDEWIVVRS